MLIYMWMSVNICYLYHEDIFTLYQTHNNAWSCTYLPSNPAEGPNRGEHISRPLPPPMYYSVKIGLKIHVLHLNWKYNVNSIKEYCIVEWWRKRGALSKLYWFVGQGGFVGSPKAWLRVVWCNFQIIDYKIQR